MTERTINIPSGITFDDLELQYEGQALLVNVDVLEYIQLSNFLADDFFEDDDRLMQFLTTWYHVHRERGGTLDLVMEHFLDKCIAKDLGKCFVFPPGNA